MASLTLTPLHESFGAECHNVDFTQPVPEATIVDIRAAMAKYGVLVFRRTQLDDLGHEQFARQFGEPDLSAVNFSRVSTAGNVSAELVDVSNIGKDGLAEPVDSLKSKIYKGNGLFHVDCSYNERRAGFSILRACKLPPPGTGGATEFADTRTAYDDLDDKTKENIKDDIVCHSIVHSRRLGASDFGLLRWLRITDFPYHYHKLVQLHEPSGRTNLYIAAHAHHINDMSEEESRPVIRSLLEHASSSKYTFTVDWKDEGDMVMWDNTCVMHRACGGSFHGKYIRDMRRATIYDDSSYAYGVKKPAAWGIRWTFWLSSIATYLGS